MGARASIRRAGRSFHNRASARVERVDDAGRLVGRHGDRRDQHLAAKRIARALEHGRLGSAGVFDVDAGDALFSVEDLDFEVERCPAKIVQVFRQTRVDRATIVRDREQDLAAQHASLSSRR